MDKEEQDAGSLNEFQLLLSKTRYTFYAVFLFAFGANALMLITPFYALQVLGRVIPTGNFDTLFIISLIVAIVYLVYSLIIIARSYTLIKLANWLDNMVGYVLFKHAIIVSSSKPNMRANNLMRDFQRFKNTITSVITVVFDMPFAFMYLIALYIINFNIFVWTLFAGTVIICLSLLNASITTALLNQQSSLKMKADYANMKALQNAKIINSMGIIDHVCDDWKVYHLGALGAQMSASYRNTFILQTTALLRNWFQMGISILGAYSVIVSNHTDMTVGMMIVCSILFGKFLGPFSQMLSTYKQMTMAYFSYLTLDKFFSQNKHSEKVVSIPNPNLITGELVVESVGFKVEQEKTLMSMLSPSSEPKHLLSDISMSFKPGDFAVIIGDIGSGKSLLMQTMIGNLVPTSGRITLNNIDVSKCKREEIGKKIGVAFQEPFLFHVTIGQNIAGMDKNYKLEDVVNAAKMAGLDPYIQSLPKGYETNIGVGPNSIQPSAGQSQLFALARMLYKYEERVIFFLDEINANLDRTGNETVLRVVQKIKNDGKVCIMITHRPGILPHADRIYVIHKGRLTREGKPDEIINIMQKGKGG